MRTPLLFTAALLAATLASASERGKPPISVQTMKTGGPLIPERAALRLARADVDIEVLPDREQLKGVATLTLTTGAPLDRLLIDLDTNLPVSAISIDGVALAHSAWTNRDGQLVITLPRRLPAGASVVARIAYAGTPHVAVRAPWDDGIVWSQAGGKPWVATTAQGYGCDLFWPCLDFPAGEVGELTMHVTVPAGLSAPGNGVWLGTDTLPDGRTRWNWRAKAINPYLVTLAVGPYTVIRAPYQSRFGNVIPMEFWHLKGREAQARGLFAEFAPTLDFYESVIGPFPFADQKLGVVETPHLGMEHQTLNAYGNNYAKAPEGFDWLFHHELAHEWFGNQMTAADWDDFWLHEGFGQYMQPLYGRWREGEARYAAMMAAQRVNIRNAAPLVSGRSRTSEDVYEDDRGGPGGDIYYKGAWVLHSLRNLIGDAAFFDATRRLVYGRPDPRPGNFKPRFASTAEFETLASAAAGRDLRWFFDVYVRRAALPELVQARSGGMLTLTWKTPDALPFPMPVEVQVDGVVRTVAMPDGTATISVPATAHVVIDPMARILMRSEAVELVQTAGRMRQ